MYRLKSILSRLPGIRSVPWTSATLLFLIPLSGRELYSQTGSTNPRVLARVGDRFIDEREFIERFELTPGLNRRPGPALKEEKQSVLFSLIAEKLLALEGIDLGLERDTSFQHAFLEIRKLMARDQLYREEISKKIQVSRTEVMKGMAQAKRELIVSYIFFESRSDAEFVRKQIRNSPAFEMLVIDSSMNALRDTATVIWGDADWNVERAAYQLKKNSLSGIVEAGAGFYLLNILKEQPSQHFNSLSAEALEREVRQTLRLRKERVRLDEFIRTALKEKKGYAIRGSVRRAASAIAAVLEHPDFRSDSTLTSPAVNAARGKIQGHLSGSIAVAGSEVWSIDDVFKRLEHSPVAVQSRDIRSVFGLLNRHLMMWVQQELLAQEALQRRLDETPEGARRLAVWRDAMLAAAVKERLAASTEVTEADLWTYANSKWNTTVPSARIRELWCLSLTRIQEALGELQKGKNFGEIVMKYSEDIGKAGGGIVTLPITSRPVGPIAYTLSPGQIHGPLKLGERYLVLQLVEKDTLTLKGAGLTDGQVDEAKKEVSRMKQRKTLDQFLAAQGRKRGFTVFQDQVDRVSVSAIPMMTFRLLGFGGRMMEVPFLDRQLDWLNTDVPEDLIP